MADGYPFTLNSYSRPITTPSPAAQRWFDRGLNWLYGYNQEEAVACFKRALEHDAGCAMAWWGIAYAAGPFYNRSWLRFTKKEVEQTLAVCHPAAQRAVELSAACTPVEKALIGAIPRRYQAIGHHDSTELMRWHQTFVDAMRDVYRAHPADLDVAALFAEAAVTLTPRQLWDLPTGQPKTGAATLEGMAVLEKAIAQMERNGGPPNPGVLHMYIHLLEMAPFPERAMVASDTLRDLARDEGHLHHMPAHIYVQCGDYAQAVAVSKRAIDADNAYLAYAGARNFYTTARCHDLHLLMFAAMFLGQYKTALQAADTIVNWVTPDLIDPEHPFFSSILDGYSGMRTHVQVRFGQWRALTREPAPLHPEITPIRAARLWQGGGACGARGD